MTVGNNPPKDGPYFEIRLLDNRRWKFQTADMREAKLWEKTIQKQIEASIAMNLSAGAKNTASISETKKYQVLSKEERTALAAVSGNSTCVDCASDDVPTWASLNLTAAFCIACSGVHRNLGVHISRVRSLELDDWKADNYAIMMAYGNAAVNAVYEAAVPEDRRRPVPDGPSAELESWIRDKYQHKKFMSPAVGDSATTLFNVISEGGDPEERLSAIAHCTTADINRIDHNEAGLAALHMAATRGDLHMVQLLLWAHADPNLVDGSGRTPLECAREALSTNPKGCGDAAELLASQDAAFGSRLVSRKPNKETPSSPGIDPPFSSTQQAGEKEAPTIGLEADAIPTQPIALIGDAVAALNAEDEDDGYIRTDGLDEEELSSEPQALDAAQRDVPALTVESVEPVDEPATTLDELAHVNPFGPTPAATTRIGEEDREVSIAETEGESAVPTAIEPDDGDDARNDGEAAVDPRGEAGAGSDGDVVERLHVTLTKEEGRKLGFSINVVDADVIVTKSSPGGLAEQSGIRVGMLLMELNDESCHGKTKKDLLSVIASHDVLAMVFSIASATFASPPVPTEPLAVEAVGSQPDREETVAESSVGVSEEPSVAGASQVDDAVSTTQNGAEVPDGGPHNSPEEATPVDSRVEAAPLPQTIEETVNPEAGATAVAEGPVVTVLESVGSDTSQAADAAAIIPAAPSAVDRAVAPTTVAPVATLPPATAAPKTYSDKEVRHFVKNLLRASGVQLWVAPYSAADGTSGLTDEMISDILRGIPDDVDTAQAAAAVRTLRAKSVERKERKSKQ
jgi:hypothetical protein